MVLTKDLRRAKISVFSVLSVEHKIKDKVQGTTWQTKILKNPLNP